MHLPLCTSSFLKLLSDIFVPSGEAPLRKSCIAYDCKVLSIEIHFCVDLDISAHVADVVPPV